MPTPFDRFTAPEEEARIRSLADRMIPRWVTPNDITYARFACTPFVAALMIAEWWTAALVLFIIAMLLDVVDGPLARARNQVTDHGKTLDPIVDKVAVFLPFWVWVALVAHTTMLSKFLFITGALLTILEAGLLTIRLRTLMHPLPRLAVPQANGAGKAKVWVEGWMVGVTLCGPYEPIAHGIALALAVAALALAWWSLYEHRHHVP